MNPTAKAQRENPPPVSPPRLLASPLPRRFGDEVTSRGLVFDKLPYDCSGLGEATAAGGGGVGVGGGGDCDQEKDKRGGTLASGP